MSIRRINTRSKNELVYDSLKNAIVTCEIKPGENLVIDELARNLGLSAIPIREALRQLEADGLVKSEPYVGVMVTELHSGLINEIFAMLESFEIISSLAAYPRMNEADFAAVEALLREMDGYIDNPSKWSAANAQLHQMICDYGDVHLIKMMMNKALVHWERLRHYYLKDVFALRIAEAQKDHWAIFAALKQGDPQHIEAIIRHHNRAALAAYLRHLETNRESKIEAT
jgi:DNA-binding GntR family transcriptional regulator